MLDQEIRDVATRLKEAESSVRILRSLAWEPGVREEFFARGATELPRVSYPPFDPAPVHAGVREARARIHGDSPEADWLRRTADDIEVSAELVAAVGTPRFLEAGARLFGLPTEEVGGVTALHLAREVESLYEESAGIDLGAPPAEDHTADEVAARLRRACDQRFGADAPEVLVVEELSANALAGPQRILVRRGARFTDRDAHQLVQHEAFVHVCTALNGRAQTDLPILSASHAGTTRTQEGLAVFAEFITGVMDLDRFRRLADRVLAIQMAVEGADFLEVYRWFHGRRLPREQAFENARRVFRGGVLTGGAPFLKDAVYLDGLLRVTSFLRALVAERRADCLPLLFCGKLDLEDVPVFAHLAARGLCRPPRHLPPWADDRRFLVTYLGYSAFLGRVHLEGQRAHYRALLADAPRLAGR